MAVQRIASPKNLVQLEDTTPLVRYIKVPRLLSLLQDELAFTQVDKLRGVNDPQEGREIADPVVIDTLIEEYENENGEWTGFVERSPEVLKALGPKPVSGPYPAYAVAEAFHQFMRTRRAVSCWFSSNYESAAMWAAYSAEVAVHIELKGLCDVLEGGPDMIVAAVRYRDRERGRITLDNYEKFPHIGLRPYLVKGWEFSHEKEVRFVTRCADSFEGPVMVKANGLSLNIRRVVISPYIPWPDAVQLKGLVEMLLRKAQGKSSDTLVEYSAINRLEIERHLSGVEVDRLAAEYLGKVDSFPV